MPAHPRYVVSSATPTHLEAANRLRQMALTAGDDVHKGVGAGSWLIERCHDAKVFHMGATALEHLTDPIESEALRPLRSFTTSSANEVEGTMRCLDLLGFPYRVTSGIDISNEFLGDLTGWLVEVLDAPPPALDYHAARGVVDLHGEPAESVIRRARGGDES